MDRMTVGTTYKYQGDPVKGVTVIDTSSKSAVPYGSHGERLQGVRQFTDMDIMVMRGGKAVNIEDIPEVQDDDGVYFLADEDGRSVSANEARNAIGVFAAKESGKPHVLTRDEFEKLAPIQEKALKRLSDAAEQFGQVSGITPRDERYAKYLERCRQEIKSGIPYIGKVKTVTDVENMMIAHDENRFGPLWGDSHEGKETGDKDAGE